jgi:hypothetical protein
MVRQFRQLRDIRRDPPSLADNVLPYFSRAV